MVPYSYPKSINAVTSLVTRDFPTEHDPIKVNWCKFFLAWVIVVFIGATVILGLKRINIICFAVLSVYVYRKYVLFSLAYLAGNVKGGWRVDQNNVITIDAEIVGGSPRATNFVWTIQQPNGGFIDYQPGEGPTSPVVRAS